MDQSAALDLSRWQWALTAAMHITFPAVTVGTSLLLVVCYAAYLRTDDPVWLQMFRFWRRIFGIGFALGVVSGIVMTFEFGLNWGPFARAVGPIVGVIIALEVVSAFFLEAGFLGLLVYGEGRIGRRAMLVTTCAVALGTSLSVTWILVANSWMQTPAGYEIVSGQFQPTDWAKVIFNPSFGIRLAHMFLAVLIASAWFVGGISAWYLVKHRHLALARRGLSIALGVLAVLLPVQGFVGDTVTGSYVAKDKLPQLEAMEGNWTPTNTGYNLLVVPDQNAAHNDFMLTVPGLGSVLGSKDWSLKSPVPGLDLTPVADRPAMLPTFYGFRVMFFGWAVMLAVAMAGLVLRLRGTLYTSSRFHRVLLVLIPIGVAAIWGGWITAETGRQPWIVYGKLPTAAAVGAIPPAEVLTSLILFIAVYIALLGTYGWYVARVVRDGPAPIERSPAATRSSLPGLHRVG